MAERWGKPVEEPTADVQVGLEKTRLRDGLKSVHLWNDPLPSQRAVSADYKTGLERARDEWGLAGAVVYRLFGLPARGVNGFAAVLFRASERSGRFAGLLLIVIVTAIALLIAGVI